MSTDPTSPAAPPETANPYGNPQGRSRRSASGSSGYGEPAAPESAGAGLGSPTTVVLLLALALALWFGFQSFQLVNERGLLRTAHANQEQTVQTATKLRAQLDGIARETKKLADAGNPNAKLLVDELQKRGVTINPNPPAAAGTTGP